MITNCLGYNDRDLHVQIIRLNSSNFLSGYLQLLLMHRTWFSCLRSCWGSVFENYTSRPTSLGGFGTTCLSSRYRKGLRFPHQGTHESIESSTPNWENVSFNPHRKKLCRHTKNLHTAAWFKYHFSKFLSLCRQGVWSFGDSRTQFSGGGQIPRYGRVEDDDAWLPVCHLGSLSNLLPCFLAGMQGAMHCSFLPDPLGFIKQVMCTDLWQATCWKLALDERLIIPTYHLINPQFSIFPISLLENYTLL